MVKVAVLGVGNKEALIEVDAVSIAVPKKPHDALFFEK